MSLTAVRKEKVNWDFEGDDDDDDDNDNNNFGGQEVEKSERLTSYGQVIIEFITIVDNTYVAKYGYI